MSFLFLFGGGSPGVEVAAPHTSPCLCVRVGFRPPTLPAYVLESIYTVTHGGLLGVPTPLSLHSGLFSSSLVSAWGIFSADVILHRFARVGVGVVDDLGEKRV